MKPKYKLTEKKQYGVHTLFRIQALKSFRDVEAGDFGGFVESESNLSQDGDCWIYDRYAKIKGYIKLSFENDIKYINEGSHIFGSAKITGNAKVFGYSQISGGALITDDAQVYGGGELIRVLRKNNKTIYICNSNINATIIMNKSKILGSSIVTNGKIIKNTIIVDSKITKEHCLNSLVIPKDHPDFWDYRLERPDLEVVFSS